LAVDDRETEEWRQVKVTLQVSYQRRKPATENGTEEVEETSADQYRLRARIDVHKDDVQKIVPIPKEKELINLAVLTGRQMSSPLRVLMVSQAGEVADVTLRSSCSSDDDTALKVASSCTSVYADGSETRGALAAEVTAKYGSSEGVTRVTVWMPELPLDVELEDDRLALINGWKVPRDNDDNTLKMASNEVNEDEVCR